MAQATIVIPTYERPAQLTRTLLALNGQRGKQTFDVIVVDDGSTTDTKRLIEGLPLTYAWSWHWHPHAGFRAGRARNTGILFAEGDLIILLDDDIVVPPDFVESHVDFHDHHDEAVAIGLRHRIPYSRWSAIDGVDLTAYQPIAQRDRRIEILQRDEWREVPWAYFNTCNASASKRAFLDGGLFDEAFVGWGFEDTELAYRLHQIGLHLEPLLASIPYHLDAADEEGPRAQSDHGLPAAKLVAYRANAERFLGKYPDDALVREVVYRDSQLRTMAAGPLPLDEVSSARAGAGRSNGAAAALEVDAGDEWEILPFQSVLTPYEDGDDTRAVPRRCRWRLWQKKGGCPTLLDDLQRRFGITVLGEPVVRKPRWSERVLPVVIAPVVAVLCIAMIAAMVVTGRYRRVFRRA